MSTVTKQSIRPQPSKTQSQPAKSELKPLVSAQRAEQGRGHEDEIRALAYRKWNEAGCPIGDGVEFWLSAEREILSRKKPR